MSKRRKRYHGLFCRVCLKLYSYLRKPCLSVEQQDRAPGPRILLARERTPDQQRRAAWLCAGAPGRYYAAARAMQPARSVPAIKPASPTANIAGIGKHVAAEPAAKVAQGENGAGLKPLIPAARRSRTGKTAPSRSLLPQLRHDYVRYFFWGVVRMFRGSVL